MVMVSLYHPPALSFTLITDKMIRSSNIIKGILGFVLSYFYFNKPCFIIGFIVEDYKSADSVFIKASTNQQCKSIFKNIFHIQFSYIKDGGHIVDNNGLTSWHGLAYWPDVDHVVIAVVYLRHCAKGNKN